MGNGVQRMTDRARRRRAAEPEGAAAVEDIIPGTAFPLLSRPVIVLADSQAPPRPPPAEAQPTSPVAALIKRGFVLDGRRRGHLVGCVVRVNGYGLILSAEAHDALGLSEAVRLMIGPDATAVAIIPATRATVGAYKVGWNPLRMIFVSRVVKTLEAHGWALGDYPARMEDGYLLVERDGSEG